jgi:hypothetical protein
MSVIYSPQGCGTIQLATLAGDELAVEQREVSLGVVGSMSLSYEAVVCTDER